MANGPSADTGFYTTCLHYQASVGVMGLALCLIIIAQEGQRGNNFQDANLVNGYCIWVLKASAKYLSKNKFVPLCTSCSKAGVQTQKLFLDKCYGAV